MERVLLTARVLADECRDRAVGTNHLLSVLAADGGTAAHRVLRGSVPFGLPFILRGKPEAAMARVTLGTHPAPRADLDRGARGVVAAASTAAAVVPGKPVTTADLLGALAVRSDPAALALQQIGLTPAVIAERAAQFRASDEACGAPIGPEGLATDDELVVILERAEAAVADGHFRPAVAGLEQLDALSYVWGSPINAVNMRSRLATLRNALDGTDVLAELRGLRHELDTLAEPGTPTHAATAVQLSLRLAEVATWRGALDDARWAIDDVTATAQQFGHEGSMRLAAALMAVTVHEAGGPDAEVDAHLDRAGIGIGTEGADVLTAAVLIDRGEMAAAAEVLDRWEQGLDQSPARPLRLSLLGLRAILPGDTERCRAALVDAIDELPDDCSVVTTTLAHYRLAQCDEQIGDPRAEGEARFALELARRFGLGSVEPWIVLTLARAIRRRGDEVEATTVADDALVAARRRGQHRVAALLER